ncbi:sulfatase-like hydrolase/transferase [Flagellimonas flava]|uniref:Sulfatase n=1 Tax=Flagellimonas flava TaxID=570519 RepID=A0A1M5NL91_9FLAO|nr:sulfatase-like hydrolase/transferase [Allomuricauda flava]SHG90268.1 Sulfatase [Allomuricauda flava]
MNLRTGHLFWDLKSARQPIALMVLTMLLVLGSCTKVTETQPPNILWIVSEDNSAYLGCYGDSLATTPNIDKLAMEGHLYTHAYANAPVCSPARNTIITGVYATSNGSQHMRSYNPLSQVVRFFPEYLKEKRYYCTNNAKEDYNTNTPISKEVWDESSETAHYSNRDQGQPFFHVKNIHTTHESSIHDSIPSSELVHRPEAMAIPPYHPPTADIKHDWAQYYDRITQMDAEVGKLLKELEDSGLAENTIVFYYSDHGGVLARSKRYPFETGTRVPFIIRIPDKYKTWRPSKVGGKVARMISFVDLAPTMLGLAGIAAPDHMQGKVFLGEFKEEPSDYVHIFKGRMDERYDMSRAVRDKRFRYIKNYMPFRAYGQPLNYLFRARSIQSWQNEWELGNLNKIQSAFWESKPVEELYDLENDPWETENLADRPEYVSDLWRLRRKNLEWTKKIKDAGFIPEAELMERTKSTTVYDYLRSDGNNLEKIIQVAENVSLATRDSLPRIMEYLYHKDNAIRYWGATGLQILKSDAMGEIKSIKLALGDPSITVTNVLSEVLYNLGEREIARAKLIENLAHGDHYSRVHTLNIVDVLGLEDEKIKKAVVDFYKQNYENDRSRYDLRMVRYLCKKWKIEIDTGPEYKI